MRCGVMGDGFELGFDIDFRADLPVAVRVGLLM
jgi:hypothetical protein